MLSRALPPSFRILLLSVTLMLSATAQQRFDITPLFGYRTPVSFPVTASTGTVNVDNGARARLAGGETFGAAVGVRYDETSVIEFRFTRQNTTTTFEPSGNTVNPLFLNSNTRLEQYHGDFTKEWPVETNPRIRPYLIASLGMTRILWTGRTENRFSFGIGGGFKYFPVKWFGLRIQGQWLPIWVSPEVKGFICGGGCIVALGGKLSSQAEFVFGPTFSF